MRLRPVARSRTPGAGADRGLAAAGIGALTYGAQDDRLVVAVGLGVGGIVVALPALRKLLPVGTMTAAFGLSAVIACRTLATAAFLGVDSFVPLAAHEIAAQALLQGFLIVGGAISWTSGQLWRSRHPRFLDGLGGAQRISVAGARRVDHVADRVRGAGRCGRRSSRGASAGWAWACCSIPTSLAAMSYARGGQEES